MNRTFYTKLGIILGLLQAKLLMATQIQIPNVSHAGDIFTTRPYGIVYKNFELSPLRGAAVNHSNNPHILTLNHPHDNFQKAKNDIDEFLFSEDGKELYKDKLLILACNDLHGDY